MGPALPVLVWIRQEKLSNVNPLKVSGLLGTTLIGAARAVTTLPAVKASAITSFLMRALLFAGARLVSFSGYQGGLQAPRRDVSPSSATGPERSRSRVEVELEFEFALTLGTHGGAGSRRKSQAERQSRNEYEF